MPFNRYAFDYVRIVFIKCGERENIKWIRLVLCGGGGGPGSDYDSMSYIVYMQYILYMTSYSLS